MNNQTITFTGRTVLVTGAAGFIGANLVLRLLDETKEAKINGLDNLNDYYDPGLKEYRLSQIREAERRSESTFCFLKGDLSDAAIGCAKCLGFDFKRNFNLPYIAQNITEFWRRWHISLSTWLKEYLYIPLGGNRKGKARQSLNLLVTMLLGGLWHGANWTFLAWGGIHGVALIIDKKLPHKKSRIAQILGVVVTFIFVTLAWILFRADSFTDAWAVLKGMVLLQNGIRQPFIWSFIAIGILLIATVIAIRKGKKKDLAEVDGFYPILNLETIPGLTAFFVEIGLILGLMYTGENPFVYFQF